MTSESTVIGTWENLSAKHCVPSIEKIKRFWRSCSSFIVQSCVETNKDLTNVRQVLVNTYHSPWAWPWHSDLQGRWKRGGGVDSQFLIDQLTLFKRRGADYPHHSNTSLPPDFQTFRHPLSSKHSSNIEQAQLSCWIFISGPRIRL